MNARFQYFCSIRETLEDLKDERDEIGTSDDLVVYLCSAGIFCLSSSLRILLPIWGLSSNRSRCRTSSKLNIFLEHDKSFNHSMRYLPQHQSYPNRDCWFVRRTSLESDDVSEYPSVASKAATNIGYKIPLCFTLDLAVWSRRAGRIVATRVDGRLSWWWFELESFGLRFGGVEESFWSLIDDGQGRADCSGWPKRDIEIDLISENERDSC